MGATSAPSGTAIAASSPGPAALFNLRGFIMKNAHAASHSTRLVLGALAAVALLAAASAVAASEPITSAQFAPGWQGHAQSLINVGPIPSAGRTKWLVPGILRNGEYVVVERKGDKAELIDGGYRFKVRTDSDKLYLLLPPGHGDVQALPVADVPTLDRPAPAALRQ
jgi:hypothetical protein